MHSPALLSRSPLSHSPVRVHCALDILRARMHSLRCIFFFSPTLCSSLAMRYYTCKWGVGHKQASLADAFTAAPRSPSAAHEVVLSGSVDNKDTQLARQPQQQDTAAATLGSAALDRIAGRVPPPHPPPSRPCASEGHRTGRTHRHGRRGRHALGTLARRLHRLPSLIMGAYPHQAASAAVAARVSSGSSLSGGCTGGGAKETTTAPHGSVLHTAYCIHGCTVYRKGISRL